MNSTFAKNVKFLMCKYNFIYHYWFDPLNVILKKILPLIKILNKIMFLDPYYHLTYNHET